MLDHFKCLVNLSSDFYLVDHIFLLHWETSAGGIPFKNYNGSFNFLFQVLEAVGPVIFLSTDTRKLRNEGFLSPYHPRYPDILTNSAHPMVDSVYFWWFWDRSQFATFLLVVLLFTTLHFLCHYPLQRAQDLANVTSYREWVLFGYLVCPDELLRVTSIDIAMVNPRHCSVPFCSCYAIKFTFEFSLYQEREKVCKSMISMHYGKCILYT